LIHSLINQVVTTDVCKQVDCLRSPARPHNCRLRAPWTVRSCAVGF